MRADPRVLEAAGHHDDRQVGRHGHPADESVVDLSCSLHSFGASPLDDHV